VAAPVASQDAVRALDRSADAVVCVTTPTPFFAVGEHYADFRQTTDAEVIELLRPRATPRPAEPEVISPT
jgi:putative phosphoribosyl transferase